MASSSDNKAHAELQAGVKRGIEMIGQLRYRKRDCHSLLRLVNLSAQVLCDLWTLLHQETR